MMSEKITLQVDADDVSTLREVFSLALAQSEARVRDAEDVSDEYLADVTAEHNAATALMVRLDAMLPEWNA